MPKLSFGDESESKSTPRQVYRVRHKSQNKLFTDSVIVYMAKTAWARVTTPRAVEYYVAVLRQLGGLVLLTLATIAAGCLWAARNLWETTVALFHFGRRGAGEVRRGAGSLRRGLGRSVESGVDSLGRGRRAVGRGVSNVGRGVSKTGRGVATGASTVGRGVGRTGRGVATGASAVGRGLGTGVRRSATDVGRGVEEVGRGVGQTGLDVFTDLRRVSSGLWRVTSAAARGLRRTVIVLRLISRRILAAAEFSGRRVLRFGGASARLAFRGLQRHRFVPASIALAAVLLLMGPVVVDMTVSLAGSAGAKIASLSRPEAPEVTVPSVSIPEISIPKVTFHAPRLPKLSAPELRLPPVSVPDVDFEVPEFVAGPVKRLDELLSGPLVPKGARVMIADFSVAEGPNGDLLLGNALALALEAELATARHFSVVPRERALAATNGRRFALNSEEAAALAPGAKTGVLIAGQLTMEDDWHTLSLLVLDRAGAELYNVTIQTEASALMGALREGAEKLSQRLGETRRGKNRLPPQPLLSESLPALQAYAKARAHLHAGRYYQAISASRTAARHDSAFGAAYRLMADAYAMTGQRSRARNALDRAWQYRDGLSDRERLRLGADRKALSGRYSQAIIAYDQLFNRYRDDVGALKSQAILQRMIGARGRGNGNLRVAYSIDSVDWPPIARVARFLGYRGRIPAVESFASASGD